MPRFLVILLAVLLAACQGPSTATQKDMSPIAGQAKILTVNPTLGTGTFDFNGQTTTFWWQNRSRQAATGEGLQPGWDSAWKKDPAVLEAKDSDVAFYANVGDTIAFRGLVSRGEIFVLAATVIKK